MDPIEAIRNVEKMMGVSDCRTNKNHKIVVTFYKNTQDDYVDKVIDYLNNHSYYEEFWRGSNKLIFYSE